MAALPAANAWLWRHILGQTRPGAARRAPNARGARKVTSGQALGLELAQEALEQAPVALLVVEDLDHHVLGHQVLVVAELDDPVVVLDGAGLGLDHALDHV